VEGGPARGVKSYKTNELQNKKRQKQKKKTKETFFMRCNCVTA